MLPHLCYIKNASFLWFEGREVLCWILGSMGAARRRRICWPFVLANPIICHSLPKMHFDVSSFCSSSYVALRSDSAKCTSDALDLLRLAACANWKLNRKARFRLERMPKLAQFSHCTSQGNCAKLNFRQWQGELETGFCKFRTFSCPPSRRSSSSAAQKNTFYVVI